jgi:cold shock CspA family protein
MNLRIDQNHNEYVKDLFVTERTQEFVFNFNPAAAGTANTAHPPGRPEAAEDFTSTIYSINPNGFGFIRDEGKNNIFFHYSRLTNCDFSDLKFGMKVRYTIEEDEERTKRDEMPRYRATKVTLVD